MHTEDPICPSCEYKLMQAHPNLRDWFHQVKKNHPDAHVAWSYRDKFDQDKALADGKTKLAYPTSAHNAVDKKNQPCARALDLFQQINGQGSWPKQWFEMIENSNQSEGIQLRWGGKFRSLGDGDHWELPPDIEQP